MVSNNAFAFLFLSFPGFLLQFFRMQFILLLLCPPMISRLCMSYQTQRAVGTGDAVCLLWPTHFILARYELTRDDVRSTKAAIE